MVNTMTRYDFEHIFLPSTFYSSSDLLISVLSSNGIKTLTNTFSKELVLLIHINLILMRKWF